MALPRIAQKLLDVIADLAAHAALTKQGTHGATPAYTAGTIMHRNSAGRAQVQDPAAAYDIANKQYVDAAIAASGVESTWLYPNGGTKESPGSIAMNNRFIMDSPFPGHQVKCEAQIRYSNQWGDPCWFDTANAMTAAGVMARLLIDTAGKEYIVVQSGWTGRDPHLSNASNTCGNPFGTASPIVGPLPCRIYCEKGGKL